MPTTSLPVSDELGPLISEHHSRASARWPFLLLGIASLLGGLASAGLALERWYFAYSHLGPVAVWHHSASALVAAAALVLTGVVLLLLRPRSLDMEVRQDGLRWSRGRHSSSARWSQVREIHMHATRYFLPGLGKRTQAVLVLGLRPPGVSSRKLHRLRLAHTLSDFDGLVAAVKRQAYPLLIAEMTRAFRLGRPLTFGRLRLTSEGMRQGRRLIRWPDFAQVSLENGVVRLRSSASSGRRELRVQAHQLPNLEVCLQLIDLLSRQS